MDGGYVPHSHIPLYPDGSGFYAANASQTTKVIHEARPVILSALDAATPVKTCLVKVCDYGSADGGPTFLLMRDIIDFVRNKHGEDVQLLILYEDQPVNDFKSLFLRLEGLLPGPPSYQEDIKGVFVGAIGTNFYDQCVPSNTIDLGLSSIALHWLSKRPCTLTGALQHSQATIEEEREKFKIQAAQDYQRFLLHRASELKHGGHMVILSLCIDKCGQYPGSSKFYKHSILPTMTRIWKKMADEDMITQEEFQNINFNSYYRKEEEFLLPFKKSNSAVSKAGLILVSMEIKTYRCTILENWIKNGKKDDYRAAQEHAESLISNIRVWSNTSFFSGLSKRRTEEESKTIVDEFYNRYKTEIVSAPYDHGTDTPYACIHIAKQ